MLVKLKHRIVGPFLFVLILFEISFCLGRRARNVDINMEEFDPESTLPRFSQPIPNVTVTIGKDALLPCVVDNLRSYKVAWVRVDTQTILTIHQAVITRNPRITLAHSDHRSWFLQIKTTDEKDRGWYMCQINTDPMRSLMGYLEVVVPPQIIDRETSTDLVVKEGSNVTLHCKAKGHPEPYIMWRREDNQEIQYRNIMVNVIDGDIFQITKVSRLHMGAYLCIASNGIPPSISKRVEMKVQFPPMMTIPHQLEGAYVGQEVTLECQTEAHPKSINYWTNERGDMIISGDKFESFLVDSSYKMYMRLKIRNLTQADFGSFKCVAKNSLGETDGIIKLYGGALMVESHCRKLAPTESRLRLIAYDQELKGRSMQNKTPTHYLTICISREVPAPSTTTVTVLRTTPSPWKKPKKTKPSINEVVIDSEFDEWANNKGQPNYETFEKNRVVHENGESSGSRIGGRGQGIASFKTGLLSSLTISPPRLLQQLHLHLQQHIHISSYLTSYLRFCECGINLMCLSLTLILIHFH